jgi:hypothetical protein
MRATRHPLNLNQYRKVGEKWQFVPVARVSAKAARPAVEAAGHRFLSEFPTLKPEATAG